MSFIKNLFSPATPPLIPLPNSSLITQLDLQTSYKAWLTRSQKLQLKLRALESATLANKLDCWVGPVEMRAEVRRVLAESRFVVKKLEESIIWCSNQILLNHIGKDSEGQRIFLQCPPSLLEEGFPLPLPLCPASRDYQLLLPKFFERSELPPTYHEELDVEHGEMSIGGGMVEMGRRLVRAITGS